MKKVAIVLLTICLLAVCFCSCTEGTPEESGSPSISASAKETATPTKKPTVKPTATPAPTPAYDTSAYTIEYDTVITSQNLGFLFAGYDYDNYLMAQLSIGYLNDGYLYYRPHQWIDGSWELLDEIPIDPEVAPAEYNTTIHVKLVMKDDSLTTYINGTEICQLDVEDGTYGMFGFRTSATAEEAGTFDNLSIANAEGTVVWTEDFEGETTYFDDVFLDELDAYVENGVLVIDEGVDMTFLMDPPALGE